VKVVGVFVRFSCAASIRVLYQLPSSNVLDLQCLVMSLPKLSPWWMRTIGSWTVPVPGRKVDFSVSESRSNVELLHLSIRLRLQMQMNGWPIALH
jgi:hypothetical protein